MPKKSKKSPGELENARKARLAKLVSGVDKRVRQVIKMATSTRKPVSQEDKAKILAYLSASFGDMEISLTATDISEVPTGFQF